MLTHVLNLPLSIHIEPAINRNKEWFKSRSVIPIINSGIKPALLADIEQVGSIGETSNLYRVSARTRIILRVS